MDTLFIVIIAGMAVGYVTELVAVFYSRAWLKAVLTISLSVASIYLLGIQDARMFVAAPAAAFFALTALRLATRPIVVNNSGRR